MGAFLGQAVGHPADAGWEGGVEILRVVHCIAVGILVVRVSARNWI